ncbi:MAG: hypothetical protein CL942_02425 [Desulfovibrio sp.]|nr:hypothetical protein [Desulfovibrio sp.]
MLLVFWMFGVLVKGVQLSTTGMVCIIPSVCVQSYLDTPLKWPAICLPLSKNIFCLKTIFKINIFQTRHKKRTKQARKV